MSAVYCAVYIGINNIILIYIQNKLVSVTRVGYRNPVPIWKRFLYDRYLQETIYNANFSAT